MRVIMNFEHRRKKFELDCMRLTRDELIEKLWHAEQQHNETVGYAAGMIRELREENNFLIGNDDNVRKLLYDCKQELKDSYDDVKHDRVPYMNNYKNLVKRIDKVI